MIIKVAAYQAPLLPSGSTKAIELIGAQVRTCESIGVQFLCCPEAVFGGLADYASDPYATAIDARHHQLEAVLAPLASETVTTIVGFTELDEGRLFNSAAVLHRGSVVGRYRKLHPAINRSAYEAGRDVPVFTVNGLTFGILICRDSTFHEPARAMAEQGADVLFVPTNNGMPPTKGGLEVVEQARATDLALAKENAVAVIRADVAGRANVTGRIDGLVSFGSSGIVDRDGTVRETLMALEVGLLVSDVVSSRLSAV